MSDFVSAFFDFSFSNFVTGKLVKIIYIISLLSIVVFAAVMFISGLYQGGATGLASAFVVTPFFVIFAALYARVGCELLIVIFRVFETLEDISDKLGGLSL